MGNDQTKTVLEDSGEPITYFAINIKQPDKLQIVPSDSGLSKLVTRVLEPHCRSVLMSTLQFISDIIHFLPVQHLGARGDLRQCVHHHPLRPALHHLQPRGRGDQLRQPPLSLVSPPLRPRLPGK